ncbi:MAG TPA: hypothetical protein VHY08_17560, partial [Bacillota bacterium]|nr:hypothetical protein [Bacillota bacterium]
MITVLKCIGTGKHPEHNYLNGHMQDGKVDLVASINPPYTGTRWLVEPLGKGTVALRCLGDIENPTHKYLNGNTQEGTVDLVPNTDSYTGTHWEVIGLSDGSYAFKCLGHNQNPG